jgi:hypothetical protein
MRSLCLHLGDNFVPIVLGWTLLYEVLPFVVAVVPRGGGGGGHCALVLVSGVD